MDERLANVLQLFAQFGASRYGGEAVSQLEHALQAAMFAERSGASPALIAAALLHDVGHLLHNLPEDAPEQGVDDEHEERGARWLNERFGPEVVEPVRLHVAAKRYLVATDAEYGAQLSEPSMVSLRLQGGPMTAEEQAAFRTHPSFEAAVRLRRWDEAAKVVGLRTPDLPHFARYVEQTLTAPE